MKLIRGECHDTSNLFLNVEGEEVYSRLQQNHCMDSECKVTVYVERSSLVCISS